MSRVSGCPACIVHLTCEGALNAVRDATKMNQHVFVETYIQYLLLDAYLYEKDFEAAKWVICPPLREKKDRELLWPELTRQWFRWLAPIIVLYVGTEKLGIDDF